MYKSGNVALEIAGHGLWKLGIEKKIKKEQNKKENLRNRLKYIYIGEEGGRESSGWYIPSL